MRNLGLLTAEVLQLKTRFRTVSKDYLLCVQVVFKTELVSWDVLPTPKAVSRAGLSDPLYFHFSNAKVHQHMKPIYCPNHIKDLPFPQAVVHILLGIWTTIRQKKNP